MFTINLISPTYKNIKKTKNFLNYLKNFFLYLTLLVLLSAIIILFAKKLLLDNYLLTMEKTGGNLMMQQGNKKIQQINAKIQQTRKIQADYIPWSRLLIILSNLLPEGITIDTINIDSATDQINWELRLSGLATNRETFLSLKEKLQTADNLFTTIDIPLTGIIKKNDINFNVNLTINKKALTNLPLTNK